MKILPNNIAIIATDTHLSKWIEETGRLDHDQNSLPGIFKHIKKGDTVVDIGAFIGDHTIAYARAVGIDGCVLAFEPNAEARECLLHNMMEFPNVIVYAYALGEETGKGDFHFDANAGASHITQKEGGDVYITRLDNLSEGYDNIDFIKIDAEGFELKILKGAVKTLDRWKPILYVEVNEGALNRQGTTGKELLDWIREQGYVIEGVQDGPQYDVFCFPLKSNV